MEDSDPFVVLRAKLANMDVGANSAARGMGSLVVSEPLVDVAEPNGPAMPTKVEKGVGLPQGNHHSPSHPVSPYYSVGSNTAPRFRGDDGKKDHAAVLDTPDLRVQLRASMMHGRTGSVMDRAREFEFSKPRNQHDVRRLAQVIDTLEAGRHDISLEILWRWFSGLILADQNNNNMQFLTALEWAPPTQVLPPSLNVLVHKVVKRAGKG
jgi:hypothetical protein